MFKNTTRNVMIVLETILVLVLVYSPINAYLGLAPLNTMHLIVPALPFVFFNVITDECRKYLIRIPYLDEHGIEKRKGFFYRYTY